MIPIPKIALVGRPNVGKSTLFNRICGRRKAITDSRPGSTRDRNYAQTSWQGAAFELIDTGGLLLGPTTRCWGPPRTRRERAIDEADLVVFVVDGRAGLLPDDAGHRRSGLRKTGQEGDGGASTRSRAATTEPGRVRAARLRPDLRALRRARPRRGRPAGRGARGPAAGRGRRRRTTTPLRLAIVGRPNVGKSSLLNRFARRGARAWCRQSPAPPATPSTACS